MISGYFYPDKKSMGSQRDRACRPGACNAPSEKPRAARRVHPEAASQAQSRASINLNRKTTIYKQTSKSFAACL
jgi:hypothetical protein